MIAVDFSFSLIAGGIAGAGALVTGFSISFAQIRLAVCHAHFYNQVKAEFTSWRLFGTDLTLQFMNGPGYRQIERSDLLLRWLRYTADVGYILLLAGLIGSCLVLLWNTLFT